MKMVKPLGAWAIAAIFIVQILGGIRTSHDLITPLLAKPDQSYADKMRDKWGAYYDLIEFIQRETPENAALLFGSKPNGTVDLYFLFPRRLLYGGAEVLRAYPEIDYVVISEGYPNFAVPGDKTMLDDKRGLYRVRR